MSELLQFLFSGVTVGAVYALVALGFTIIYNASDVVNFAQTLEKVCVQAVEAGHMTKDLAVLVGPDQPWMTTPQFLSKLDEMLKVAMK